MFHHFLDVCCPRCKVCNFVKTGSTFNSNVEGRSFHINHSFDCNSNGVVYIITCRICCKQYVGSTTTPFRMRFNNHKSSLIIWKGPEGYLWSALVCSFFRGRTFGFEGFNGPNN